MTVLLEEPQTRSTNAVIFTREDCERMEEIGLLPERWELVFGEVNHKMGQGLPHSFVLQKLQIFLLSLFGYRFVVPQVSIDVAPQDNPTSAPMPDLIVLNTPALEIKASPRPQQINLVVEISDTTFAFDIGPKAKLYARAGIPEYWVADIKGRKLWILRNPADGKYGDIAELDERQDISPLGRTEALQIAELFG
jgi:Uma2 family endonuclease